MKTYIVDAFTDVAFKGNPAGVCVADAELTDALSFQIAQELGLSETAFVRPLQNSAAFAIRYFSPKQEIPLCGHATLAAAQVLFETTELSELHFRTVQNLDLPVRKKNDAIEMEFPVYQTVSAEVPPRLLSALGLSEIRNAVFNAETNILLLEISSTDVLAKLAPDFPALQRSHDSINGVLVTAPAVKDGFDFHSRYFWPWSGTNEDPVTGGTHTFLAPYWSERLGKSKLRSFQSSARSGSMEIEVLGDTMRMTSQAVVVFEGRLRRELAALDLKSARSAKLRQLFFTLL